LVIGISGIAMPGVSQAAPAKSLGTITGSVKDNKGNPLAGALVSLLREGAKQVAKEARTDDKGNFIAKVVPGRYGIRAIAAASAKSCSRLSK
jgi:protocatechuate 3,4-dioxygenase beta subunit